MISINLQFNVADNTVSQSSYNGSKEWVLGKATRDIADKDEGQQVVPNVQAPTDELQAELMITLAGLINPVAD